jgi:uncharacterized DUF497 family protein
MMNLKVDGFDWDEGNRQKCQKHGVSLAEIEALLTGSHRVAPDLGHSSAEDRYIATGRTTRGRPVFVAFTFRIEGHRRLLRPVTARYMHAKEIKSYEKNESSEAENRQGG